MSGFDLPENFVEDPESLLRRARAGLTPPRRADQPGTSAPRRQRNMAEKTLREYSAPSATNVPTGPEVNVGNGNFELKTGLINMVQASPFCGRVNEDANAHLQQFLEICNTIVIRDVEPEAIRLRLFPFSLLGKAKQWFYAQGDAVNTWEKCSAAFLTKFFPLGKTNTLRGKINTFQQARDESIHEAWERYQEYILACPHHGMDKWLIIQTFYNGLTTLARYHIDAAAGGDFFDLTVAKATSLIEKIVSNQGWSEERAPPRQQKGIHPVKSADMAAAKMDLMLKQMGASMQERTECVQALDSGMTCEVCGNVGHSGNDCPETREEVYYMDRPNIGNGFRPNGGHGWQPPRPYPGNNGNFNSSNSNMPNLKDLVYGQTKINEGTNKKLAANDKTLENINAKLETLASSFKSQLSFNKMLETQLAQLAAAVPINEDGKIPGQPELPVEKVSSICAVATRSGKTTRDPPYPNHAEKAPSKKADSGREESQKENEDEEVPEKEEVYRHEKKAPHDFVDTTLLPFPSRVKKPTVDEQFTRFVEVIKKIHVNVPLLDMMQVPTYGRYLKDILSNKRPLPATEVVKLTEECSAAILRQPLEKRKDPGYPAITCSIGPYRFTQALCDLGASVSVMPKVLFDELNITHLTPTTMRLQLADATVRCPAGIAEDIPVKIRGCFVPVDFVIMDINTDIEPEMPLILGRPFLNTTKANINVGEGWVCLDVNGQAERFSFRPVKRDECSMIKIKYGPNPTNIREVEVTPPKKESLVAYMKKILAEDQSSQGAMRRVAVKKRAAARPQTQQPKKPQAAPEKTKKTQKVWRVKNVESPAPVSPGAGATSSS